MAQHLLKTDSEVFQSTWDQVKQFEIRKNDRDFRPGDRLRLFETVHSGSEMAAGRPLEYTDRSIDVLVDYVLHGPIYGLEEGWVIMSISIEDYSDEEGSDPADDADR